MVRVWSLVEPLQDTLQGTPPLKLLKRFISCAALVFCLSLAQRPHHHGRAFLFLMFLTEMLMGKNSTCLFQVGEV